MKWFQVLNKAGKTAELLIHEDIGKNWWDDSGVTSKAFIEAVRALGDLNAITLRINSRGGSLFDGVAICNYLKSHKASVTVIVDGVAASAASVVAMAGDEVVMPVGAMMMVHDPISFAFGNSAEMRKAADDLDKIKEGFLGAYTAKTGMPREDVWDLLTAETWMTAEEAVAWGFADRVDAGLQVAACDRAALAAGLKVVAAELQARAVPPAPAAPEPAPEIPPAAAAAGPEPAPASEPPAPAPPEPAAILALCEEAKLPWLAIDAIRLKLSPDLVQARIGRVQAARDVCAAVRVEPTQALLQAAAAAEPADILRHAVDCVRGQTRPVRSQHGGETVPEGKVIDYAKIYAQYRRT